MAAFMTLRLRASLRCNHGTSTRTLSHHFGRASSKQQASSASSGSSYWLFPHALDQKAIPMPIVKGHPVASRILEWK
jgi:hypothetical protein